MELAKDIVIVPLFSFPFFLLVHTSSTMEDVTISGGGSEDKCQMFGIISYHGKWEVHALCSVIFP